jgi:SWI/SNF-related matrix-associated actin-dependent regulator 1 of chromatin subfamily A
MIDVTFRGGEALISFSGWPPPPEKDEIKDMGARWNPTTKKWSIELTPAIESWLTSIGHRPPLPEPFDPTSFNVPAPKGMTYRPFQKEGVAFALDRQSVLLADEMGLGKTIQAIGVINADPEVHSALIVCPLSVALNWRDELGKWLVRDLSVGVATSKDWPDTDIVIAHWGIVAKHTDALREHEWDLIALDEAHYAKNPKAKRTKAIFGYRDMAPLTASHKLALTGTPIPNRPVELFPLLKWLAPGKFGTWRRYVGKYCHAYQDQWGWHVDGASNLDELQEHLRRLVMIRRLKKDVLTELPPKTRQVILLDPNTPELRAVLRSEAKVEKETKAKIEKAKKAVAVAKGKGPEAYKAAVEALKLAKSIEFSELSKVRHDTALAKVPQVVAHAQDILRDSNQKLVIFAHHRDVIEEIRGGLELGNDDTPGVVVVSIMGGDDPEDRQLAVDLFQHDLEVRVFIGSIGAAKEGITLTAADISIFAELDWVPGNLSQAEDRIHRIGQQNSVLIQHLLVDGSIDAKMSHDVLAKQAVLDQALDGQ